MGALVGLGVGLGLLLIWSAFFVPRTPKEPRPGGGRGRQLLARAGLGDVSVASLTALCLAFSVVAFVVIQAVSRTVPVAIAFSLMAGYTPIAVVKQRAAKRQREFAEVWPDAVHAWHIFAPVVPEAMAAIDAVGSFVRKKV